MENKIKKISACFITSAMVFSCSSNIQNVVDRENSYKLPIVKADFKLSNNDATDSNLLLETFESKVPIKPFKLLEKLPEGKNFDFRFEVTPKKLGKNQIKINENGDFKLTIKKGTKFSVIDNDATDGNATIEIPESSINSFIGISEKEDERKSISTAKLTVEDSLYYGKQEIKPLSNKEIHEIFEKNKKDDDKKFEVKKYNPEKEKEKNEGWYTDEREDGTWYQIGKRPVPIPSEWKSDTGNDYVLSFKNQGIKQFDFKGYKVSNTNDYEYPDGIGKIGIKGGAVALTGVGKIEIPEGALNNDTTIVLRQELQSYSLIDIIRDNASIYDYISPIIKIEPFGLKLNKTANIYAETNKTRLGNNHPYVIEGNYSSDKIKWIGLDNVVPVGTNKREWKADFPFGISQFGFFSKFIPNYIKPDSKYDFYLDDVLLNTSNFVVKASNFDVNKVFLDHFEIDKPIPSSYTKEIFARDKERLSKAYSYFNSLTNLNPSNLGKNNKIHIIVNSDSNNAYTGHDKKGYLTLVINTKEYALEHELWHAFQESHSNSKNNDKYYWIVESSASYMGAKAYEKYGESLNSNTGDREKYIQKLSIGVERQNNKSDNASVTDKRLDLPINWGKPTCTTNSITGEKTCVPDVNYLKNYNATDFFTFLANNNTGLGGDSYIMETLYAERINIMNYYHDYAVHSYIRDRFLDQENKPANTITPIKMFIGSDGTDYSSTDSKSFDLYNNSSRYFSILTTSKDNNNPTLGLKIETTKGDCEKNTKASIIFLNENSETPVKTPQYLDPNNPTQISAERIARKEVNKDGIVNIKANRRYPFLGVNKDFTNPVIVVSNTNGLMYETNTEDKSKCSYTIESCLYCFD